MSSSRKRRVVVLFGGRSAEHEVSCTSAVWALRSIDQSRYDVTAIGITRGGEWVRSESAAELLAASARALAPASGARVEATGPVVDQGAVLGLDQSHDAEQPPAVEAPIVFPILHGPNGEDGTIQGLLEVAGLPFVGSGVLASAVAMDKVIAKDVFRAAGIPQARYTAAAAWELDSAARRTAFLADCERELGFPMFLKPANLGSSVGVSKAHDVDEFATALELALQYDDWVIVEEAINGREIEFAVLGNEDPRVSVGGEILPGREFYDYEDKYLLDGSMTQIPAALTEAETADAQAIVLQAYRALRCEGLSRVDLFYDDGSVRPDGRTPKGWILNEINTIPGLTPISMYPKLWEASGIAATELVDALLDHAVRRFERRRGRVGRGRV